jgi:2,3-bisphosphoglycerate-independent phosphoglycerate mutase
MILDGFGDNPTGWQSAICQAKTPYLDRLMAEWPHTTIGASEEAVGLPKGQMGNSEVGHLNLGAGRIVYQELTRIGKAITDGEFARNESFLAAIANAQEKGGSLHLLGLVSDGGVHSHLDHLLALLDLATEKGLKNTFVHAFLDGRDVPPRSAGPFLDQVETKLNQLGLGHIATISGRYYAMDRDKRWDRVEKAYDAMTLAIGPTAESAGEALKEAYDRGENDEFVSPTVIIPPGQTTATIGENDSVIFFNFRPDRAREMTRALVDPDFNGFKRKASPAGLFYVCMTEYDKTIPHVQVAYPPQRLTDTLGEYLSVQGYTQLRIAETEKYAHVTFFFNGGVEPPNPGEDRVLIPSPKVPTYDLKPEMSALEVTQAVVEHIQSQKYNFIILNFANPDMVGHTGVMEATISAIETLDSCVQRVVDAVLANKGQLIITSDHGNADYMLNEQHEVVTAHSLSPVPLIVIGREHFKLREGGVLADVAPTLLDLAGLTPPKAMTGRSLLLR